MTTNVNYKFLQYQSLILIFVKLVKLNQYFY